MSQEKSTRVTLGQSAARRAQLIGLALMVLCLVGVFLIQPVVSDMRLEKRVNNVVVSGIVPAPPEAMKQLTAEFPRLTLGGFRGLLVPVLWHQSENNKNDRKWQDLNTTYNIIGKLQPYFVAVYVYNAWNQAYNLSAQWHGIDDKYQWVLEGLTHLYEGEQYNPRNPDILLEIAQMYFMKLGNSFERITYRQMWRDSIAHQYQLEDKKLSKSSVERHLRVRKFILLPQFHATLLDDVRHPNQLGYGIQVTGLRKKADGSDDPVSFRYGVSPFYFAYIEYKRCLQMGIPTTTSLAVAHGEPAMSLRLWCRDDSYFAQSTIREMFYRHADGTPASPEIAGFEDKVLELRDCFRNVPFVSQMALEEFNTHLMAFPSNRSIHNKHMLETRFIAKVAEAESEMFEGLVSYYLGEQKTPRVITAEARQHLQASLPKYEAAIDSIQQYLDQIYPVAENGYVPADRADFTMFQTALQERAAGVKAMLLAGPNEPLDFSFLKSDTIER